MTAEAATVLVVDDDEGARRLVRMGLELEGVTVVEAESLRRARAVLSPRMTGVVLDRQLPDGDGLELLGEIGATCPNAAVVINSTLADGREPAWVDRVDKGDVPGIVRVLDLASVPAAPHEQRLAVVDLVREEAEAVVQDWAELCQWDPLLPPDSSPPVARSMVDAVADALQRPQPLGWGADPALRRVTEAFATSAGTIDVAIGQLVCLREAFRRHVAGHVPTGEEAESRARVDMIIDRAIWSVARVAAARMQRRLSFDATTGLPNRDAFDRDVEREMNRARRYQRPLSIVLATMDTVDDDGDETEFQEAVEAQMRRAASLLVTNVRAQDVAYRTGPATLALLLPETNAAATVALLERIGRSSLPGLSLGAAAFPDDGDDVVSLLHEAEHRRGRTLAM